LESVVAAAAKTSYPVEIIVADNASTDNTKKVVQDCAFSGLKYVFRNHRMSMRQNFETSLDDVTGDFVIFIGDDDAVLPNGLEVLGKFIEATGADVVNWPLPGYNWPEPKLDQPGHLKVMPFKISGRSRKIDTDAALKRLTSGSFRTYHDGAVTYHGCVSTKTIECARAKSEGTYFWCQSPDVFAAMHNLMIPDLSYWKLDLPITLGGASPRSNGRSGQRFARRQEGDAGKEFQRFIAESENDEFVGRLPTDCPSLSLITLDALQMALKFQGRNDFINKDIWRNRIVDEIGSMVVETRVSCAKLAGSLLGMEVPVPQTPAPVEHFASAVPGNVLKGWPMRGFLTNTTFMSDVATAAATLDQICGMKNFRSTHRASRLRQVWRTARQLKRAALIL
jgi:hypothetical protein